MPPIVLDGTTGITTPGLTNTGTETIVNLTTTGNTILGDASTDTLNVGNGGLVKDASGNVGIGIAADERLTVSISNPTDGRVASLRNSGTSSLTGTKLWFNQNTVDNWNIGQPAGVNAFVFCNSTGSTNERMRIDSSGNVGIGTNAPIYKLEVVGERIGLTNGNSGAWITHQIQNQVGTAFYIGNESSSGGTFVSTPYSRFLWSSGAYPMVFGVNNSERMRIDSSGNLLVGTTNFGVANGQTKSILVQGPAALSSTRTVSIFASNAYSTSAGLPAYVGNWASSATWGVGPDSGANDSTIRLGVVASDANGAYWTGYAAVKGGAYTNASDYRLKKNVETVTTTVLPLIQNLRPVSYNMIQKDEDGNDVDTRKEIGFIAHELQEHFPDFVTGEKDEVNGAGEVQAQGVDYAKFTAILTKAIQEQQALIQQLQADVAALKGTP